MKSANKELQFGENSLQLLILGYQPQLMLQLQELSTALTWRRGQ